MPKSETLSTIYISACRRASLTSIWCQGLVTDAVTAMSEVAQHLPSPSLYGLAELFIIPNVDCIPRASTSLRIICLIKFKEEMFREHRFLVPLHSMPGTLMRTKAPS